MALSTRWASGRPGGGPGPSQGPRRPGARGHPPRSLGLGWAVRGWRLPRGAGAGAPGHHGGQANHQQRAGGPRPVSAPAPPPRGRSRDPGPLSSSLLGLTAFLCGRGALPTITLLAPPVPHPVVAGLACRVPLCRASVRGAAAALPVAPGAQAPGSSPAKAAQGRGEPPRQLGPSQARALAAAA